MALKTSNEKKISRTKKKINQLYAAFDQESEIEMSAWQQVKEAEAGITSYSSKRAVKRNSYRMKKGNEQRLQAAQTKGRLSRHIMRVQNKLDKYEEKIKKTQEDKKEKSQKDREYVTQKKGTRSVKVQGKPS
ncbi:hypothetical protein [Alkalicoccus saliphilus]|jgi:hypothetical protein|uniref:Uncharacterized protein n=1 Tax=Alkalicoccus saliphilus TaxID=200989 RepID=A0A2T4U380_9BACI|nr:hypothetical protein [Alkalicoccus saliphilus]PTL37861.1 hypothetical protein C6Y45_14395 [Alkalicoccus saliphilus]